MEKYKVSVKPRRSLRAVPLLSSRCPERTAPGGRSLGDKWLIWRFKVLKSVEKGFQKKYLKKTNNDTKWENDHLNHLIVMKLSH